MSILPMHIQGFTAKKIYDAQYPSPITIDFKSTSTAAALYNRLVTDYPNQLVTSKNTGLRNVQRTAISDDGSKCYMYGGYNASINYENQCLFELNFGNYIPVQINVRFIIGSLGTNTNFHFNLQVDNQYLIYGHKAGSSSPSASGNYLQVRGDKTYTLQSSSKIYEFSLKVGTNFPEKKNMNLRLMNRYGYAAGSGYAADVYTGRVYFSYINIYFDPNTIS